MKKNFLIFSIFVLFSFPAAWGQNNKSVLSDKEIENLLSNGSWNWVDASDWEPQYQFEVNEGKLQLWRWDPDTSEFGGDISVKNGEINISGGSWDGKSLTFDSNPYLFYAYALKIGNTIVATYGQPAAGIEVNYGGIPVIVDRFEYGCKIFRDTKMYETPLNLKKTVHIRDFLDYWSDDHTPIRVKDTCLYFKGSKFQPLGHTKNTYLINGKQQHLYVGESRGIDYPHPIVWVCEEDIISCDESNHEEDYAELRESFLRNNGIPLTKEEAEYAWRYKGPASDLWYEMKW